MAFLMSQFQLNANSGLCQFLGASTTPNHGGPLHRLVPTRRERRRRRRRHTVLPLQVRSGSTNITSSQFSYAEGELQRPRWAGETPISRLVANLIAFKPLYNLMKIAAKRVLISTAEKNGIPWKEMTKEILASEVYKEKEVIENPKVIYPDYYLKPFHAYEEGNLSWEAAAEVEAATMSMMKRTLPSAASIEVATQIVRGNWLQVVEDHHLQNAGDLGITDILDVGCSVGVSTRCLADKFPCANVCGLDLSPYFLAVGQHKEKMRPLRKKPIKWIHANGEETGLPSASFDIVSLAYVTHECPQHAIRGLLKEAYRLLKPGCTVALTDNSPKAETVQNLPPVLFTLMKATEPHLDEYYTLDLEKTMQEVGFVNICSVLTDPRHRTVTGSVPRM